MKRTISGRTAGFVIIALVYFFAAALGIGVYWLCPFSFAVNLLLADVAATVSIFIFSLIFRNASVYDPYWSVQPPVIVTTLALVYGVNTLGLLLLIAIWFWAIRLTANWAYTFHGLAHQDWRYSMLKEKTGAFYPVINFIGIHMVPTLVVYGCTLPAVYAIVYGYDLAWPGVVFFITALLSATLQGAADIQMQAFRKQKTATFIRTGLWKYCRHPNYLGEILIWWSIALAVVSASGVWWLLAGAMSNTLLFLCVSIPLADGRQSKKPGWAHYKRATWALLPIYKKQ